MLDTTTKQKIDSARQILVGKVPDPKAQVEQITTALIYKFMDDMDKEAEELGGKAEFFTDDLKDFAWSKLLDTRYSGQERMDLYVRAISAFAKAKQLPQLFRDIFKDTFLPYRDPETLSLFLKEINNFTYDHSEDLGNAFEYLLSVLGSQGNAGQFRTPRHIIDFIVAVVAPKKNETVLDPACGTAGFLISAYKYIRKHNSSNFKPKKEKAEEKAEEKLPESETIAETMLAEKSYRGDLLTPSERNKLMNNFVGYDISSDMVKLSLVNMYLHGFSDPKIYEYDTLTSEKHWGEQFDVIMANPPFMSPKGGIRPHKRFSVQANRSEVLFVDYILEHLNLKGRAGIIVPEGIIFKTENAYKHLRQMLVEDGLFAVVSLPPGVFNPYSGVKTSILFFDNGLAKKTKEILFLKIQNDGYGLGAQRREIDKNDLPLALEIIKKYRAALKENKKFELNTEQAKIAHLVAKDKIAESGDYNLSGDRYIEAVNFVNQKWPLVKFGDVVFDMKDGGTPSRRNSEYFGGDIYWCVVKDIKPEIFDTTEKITKLGLKNSSAKIWPIGSIIISLGASIGHVGIAKVPIATKQGLSGIMVDKSKILPKFLVHILVSKKEYIQSLATGGTIKEIRPTKLKELFVFSLPPLVVQKEIVEQIEVKQKAIEAAKAVIDNLERERRYFGQSLRKIKDVGWVEFPKYVFFQEGPGIRNWQFTSSGVKLLNVKNIVDGQLKLDNSNKYVSRKEFESKYKHFLVEEGDIILASSGASWGKTAIFNSPKFDVIVNTSNIRLHTTNNKNLNQRFLKLFLETDIFKDQIKKLITGSAQPNFGPSHLKQIKLPLPPLETQKQLVAEVEKEEEMITANRRLIELMEKKISKILEDI